MDNGSCLIIVDVQKGIFKLKQPIHNSDKLIGNLQYIISDARKKNIQIIFTQHENKTFLKKHSSDWEIIEELKPFDKNDIIILKRNPSIFMDTNLSFLLKEKNIHNLYVAGLISNGCIKDTCLDGLKNSFEINLISDTHSTFYKDADKIISNINNDLNNCGVKLISCKELW